MKRIDNFNLVIKIFLRNKSTKSNSRIFKSIINKKNKRNSINNIKTNENKKLIIKKNKNLKLLLKEINTPVLSLSEEREIKSLYTNLNSKILKSSKIEENIKNKLEKKRIKEEENLKKIEKEYINLFKNEEKKKRINIISKIPIDLKKVEKQLKEYEKKKIVDESSYEYILQNKYGILYDKNEESVKQMNKYNYLYRVYKSQFPNSTFPTLKALEWMHNFIYAKYFQMENIQ